MSEPRDRGIVKNRMIEEVARAGAGRDRGRVDSSPERVTEFVAHYLDHVPVADLEQMDPAGLVQILDSHFRLASRRAPGTDLVTVTTPGDEDQWHLGGSALLQVVTDDRPFLVDSATMEITRQGWSIRQAFHPQYLAVRGADGELADLVHRSAEASGAVRESWMAFVIYPPLGESAADLADALRSGTHEVLAQVRAATEDWQPMREQMTSCLEQVDAGAPDEQRYATSDLLAWLLSDNFTFLGYRQYDLVDGRYQPQPGTGLGILRGDEEPTDAFQAVPAPGEPVALVAFTKDSRRSRVHRSTWLDYIGVRVLDDAGQVVGERRFVGVLAAQAYDDAVIRIPALAAKLNRMIERSGYDPASHGAKAMLAAVNKYPRNELFQASPDDLYPVIEGIAGLGERRQVRLFVHQDPWRRYVSCLVYLPRERYTTDVRVRVQDVLLRAFGGTRVDYQVQVGESVLAQLHLVVQLPAGDRPEIDLAGLEREVAQATRSWADRFTELVQGWPSEDRGVEFSEAYVEEFSPEQAVADLDLLNGLARDAIAVRLASTSDSDAASLRLRLYSWSRTALPQVLPHLERLGVEVIDEWPYELRLRDQPAWLYEFGLRADRPLSQWSEQDQERFIAAFTASQTGLLEVDSLNALVTKAGLDWQEVTWLRAMLRYLKQAGLPYSVDFMGAAMVTNPRLAAQLVGAFRAAHEPSAQTDPARQRQVAEELLTEVEQSLEQVASLDQDRLFRALVALQRAVVRTNAFAVPEGGALAFKLLPRELDLLPQPRPEFEIWVSCPRVEGVHLRFGKVARGGLRWSDRSEDFRTEVLGLAKAQMVKNTVIVPVGAKGGFVPRHLPDPAQDRGAWLEEGKAAYRVFITSLLSLTDSIGADGEVVPPAGVVRHDPDDPYLVVAADKGTATFSDLANEVSLRRGFWLGDAFASGGSKGYDHKAMGITARGAWESVKRHFFEMGTDCQSEDFTCVGIGDMSGDVFGNGMLRSRHTRLLAAFDHRHIFIDPDPDPEVSFDERQRLARLPRSSWADYNPELISAGGGVYPRTAKSVPVTEPARQVLGLGAEVSAMTPTEYIHAILQAPVDLLWNGGIGTYVKGSSESHADVGDRANDAIRVDGCQVRARCAGEGGNLGWTQAGRIEYARAGGRVNTDFIDNSAGVDTSDHEVNIKILLASLVAQGEITEAERDEMLPQMSDEVAALVLAHNIDQNQALAMAAHGANRFTAIHEDWMRVLEGDGYLDREIEQMPSSVEVRRRIKADESLVAPELATLMAWTKIWLADIVLASDLPDDPYLADRLVQYFPAQLRDRFRDALPSHRLGREIITTVAVNRFVNSQGITAFHRLSSDTGAAAADVIRAQLAARAMFRVGPLEVQLGRLALPAQRLTDLRIELRHMVDRGTRWALQTQSRPLAVQAIVDQYAEPIQQVVTHLAEVLTPEGRHLYEEVRSGLEAEGVPAEIARAVAGAPFTPLAPTIASIAASRGRGLLEVAADFFAIREQLGLYRFFDLAEHLDRVDRWSLMAQAAVRDELLDVQARLADEVVAGAEPGSSAEQAVARFIGTRAEATRVAGLLDELAAGKPDLGRLSVAVRMLRSLLAG